MQVTCGVAVSVIREVVDHIETSLEVGGVAAKTIVSGAGATYYCHCRPFLECLQIAGAVT